MEKVDRMTEEHKQKVRWNEVYRRKGTELGMEQGDFIVAATPEKVYALAPAVYYIWSSCDGETTVGSIVEALKQGLGTAVDADTLYEAVVDIIDRLVEADLLERVS